MSMPGGVRGGDREEPSYSIDSTRYLTAPPKAGDVEHACYAIRGDRRRTTPFIILNEYNE